MTKLLFRDDPYQKSCASLVTDVTDAGIQLNTTIFYPTGGGQPGDTGWLHWPGGQCRISDTLKGATPDEVLHIPAAGEVVPPPGTAVTAMLDWERRYAHMKMHTTLHLLCAVVPGAVTGGQVGAEKSRLDFDIPGDSLDKAEVEARLNQLIAAAHPVSVDWLSDEQLAANPELVNPFR